MRTIRCTVACWSPDSGCASHCEPLFKPVIHHSTPTLHIPAWFLLQTLGANLQLPSAISLRTLHCSRSLGCYRGKDLTYTETYSNTRYPTNFIWHCTTFYIFIRFGNSESLCLGPACSSSPQHMDYGAWSVDATFTAIPVLMCASLTSEDAPGMSRGTRCLCTEELEAKRCREAVSFTSSSAMLVMNSAALFLGIWNTIEEALKASRAGTSQAGHCSRESALRNSNLQSRSSRKGSGADEFLRACSEFVPPFTPMQSLTSYLDVLTLRLLRW